MASPPTAPRVSQTQAESSSTGLGRPSRDRRPGDRPFPAPPPAAPARRRSRTAVSCRRARDWAAYRGSRPRAPAPCRRSGNYRGRPGGSADASGRCRWRLRALRPSACRCRDRLRGRLRIWSGSRPSRNGRCRRDGRSDACLSRGPPSCRRRDRARWRWRAVVAVAAVIVMMPAAAACVRALGLSHRILHHLQPIPGRGI